jgi:putative ABC transport system substrate-binding protein
MIQIRRREFVRSLGALSGAAVLPRAAGAQEPGRIYRLGDLHLSARTAPWNVALFSAVKADGFVVGENLLVDEQGFALNVAQLPEHAAAVVKAKVDLIIAGGDPNVRAAQQATKEIAILGIAEDMVGSRFVASLAKPGGNTTGVSLLSSELDGKRQEILMEALPGARRYAALADINSSSPQRLNALEELARARGAELSIYPVTKSEDFAGAIEAAKNSGAAALNVLASTLLFNNRQIILARAAALGLPVIYQWPTVPAEGALIGYGPRLEHIYGNIFSRQLVKLLRGISPADIPVQQPDKFELAVNLKVAKSLGLTIPNALLARADEVIE